MTGDLTPPPDPVTLPTTVLVCHPDDVAEVTAALDRLTRQGWNRPTVLPDPTASPGIIDVVAPE